MSRIKVSAIAEKLGIDSREVISRLKEIGIDAKTATSMVDENALKKLAAPLPSANPDEVRVTSNIIRRRARIAPAADEEFPFKAEEAKVDAMPENAPKEAVKHPETAHAEKEKKTAPSESETEHKKDELSPAMPAKQEKAPLKPPMAPEVEQVTPNQARILGKMDIPGVTSRPTHVVRRESAEPVAQQRHNAPYKPRTPNDAARRQSTQGHLPTQAHHEKQPDLIQSDRQQTKQQQPQHQPYVPSGDEKRKVGKSSPAFPDSAKPGSKKVAPQSKKKEQTRKNEVMEKRERIFDPVYKGPRKKGKDRAPDTRKTEITVPKAIKRIIRITETISVGELAKRMGIKANDLIKSLMKMGMMVTINHPLDFDTSTILSSEYGYEIENVAIDLDEIHETSPDAPEKLEKRPPVVTIMGHVDHGKTSLLDAIREANVIAGEAGGITQHIGAYDVELGGRKITFLDTPGHEAFTAMRARGAKVTDIVVLVVAADDGVMPQTREAINHSKAAGVPIIVAINKIDKPDAKPERVKQELMEFGIVASEWGGDATMVEVSAKKRVNLDGLLEMILLQADIMDLKANPDKQAKGTIVEAKLDKGRGPVATVLVQEGTLKNGDYCVVGIHSGRVRAMQNDRGEKVAEAGPSTPVEVIGLSGIPDAGDIFVSLKDERQAREIATLRQIKQREMELAKHSKITLEDLYKQIQTGEVKELNVIVKGDVQGSSEAVSESLRKLATDAIRLNVIHSGVGAITETDVNLAAASNAIIIGFSVRPQVKAQSLAEKEGVDIRLYNIIYDAVEDVKKAMEGLLAPTLREKYLGRAEIREVFSVPKVGNIAGCYIQDGKMLRNAQARLLRDNKVIYEGKLSSLRRVKDDVKEVASGYECGIGLENYNDIKTGDLIEAFEIEKIAAKL